jgi:hypothetical protein
MSYGTRKVAARVGAYCAFAGSACALGGEGLLTYGFLIVPVGVGWTIAAGVVLLRYESRGPSSA